MAAYIGHVLGWKFDHFPGISTRDGEITEWPKELGERPTPEQVAQWAAEYELAQAEEDQAPPATPEGVLELLVEKGVLAKEDVPGSARKAIDARRVSVGKEKM